MADIVAIGVQPEEERRKALCIELLEKMLAEAKEGRGFETFFIVGTFPDHPDLRTAWTEGMSTLEIVARLAWLQHDLLAEMHQRTS